KTAILVLHWLPDGELPRWTKEFPDCVFLDGRSKENADRHSPEATVAYGLPDLERLDQARNLRWIQLASAGMPMALCAAAQRHNFQVTNLAGLYGPTIAEHTLALMLTLSRNLHIAQRNQQTEVWDRSVMDTMRDLSGKTVAIIGLGNIGR